MPATLKLVENYGGLTLRIPYGKTPLGRAMLADIAKRVDHDTARALARKYAATELYIPNCKLALVKVRDAAILRDRAELAEQGLYSKLWCWADGARLSIRSKTLPKREMTLGRGANHGP